MVPSTGTSQAPSRVRSGEPATSARKRRPDRKAWLIAWALTLALHGGAVVGFRNLPGIQPAAATTHRPEPVQLVFVRPASEVQRTEAPHFFSELPPDKADKAPVKVDFLSNVTSRARDRVPGGDAALPRMKGEGDAPMVALDPQGGSLRPPTASSPAPQPSPPAVPRTVDPTHAGDAREQGQTATDAPRPSPPKPPEENARPASNQALPGAVGSFDIHQPEMDNPDGNAALTGDISLNTTAWDYAPWLMRFRRQLLRQWIAPQAYYMGILKEGGWAVLEAEISRSGKLLRLELLEQQGHPSLIAAARGALHSMAPIEPLPASFPEPTLILRIRMIYPKIYPR